MSWSQNITVTKIHHTFFILRHIIFHNIPTYENRTLLRKISLKMSFILVRKKRKLNLYLFNNSYIKLKNKVIFNNFLLRLFQMQLKRWPRKDQKSVPYPGLTCLKSHQVHFPINMSAHLEKLLKKLIVTLNTLTIKALMISQNEFWSWKLYPTGWLIVRQTISL